MCMGIFLFVCLYTSCMSCICEGQRGYQIYATGVTDGYELLRGCLEFKPDPLQEQQVFWATKPSFQAHLLGLSAQMIKFHLNYICIRRLTCIACNLGRWLRTWWPMTFLDILFSFILLSFSLFITLFPLKLPCFFSVLPPSHLYSIISLPTAFWPPQSLSTFMGSAISS